MYFAILLLPYSDTPNFLLIDSQLVFYIAVNKFYSAMLEKENRFLE